MPDIGAVHPPSGPPDNTPSKKSTNVDSDKFQKEMHKRVEKVSETDPEQQKKRKSQSEAEEEEDLEAPVQGPTTPAELVTPFSLGTPTTKASPAAMQKGGMISPMASAQPTKSQGAPAPSPTSLPVPSADEMEDDSGLTEEPTLTSSVTPSAPQSLEETAPPTEETPPEVSSASITEFAEEPAPATPTPQAPYTAAPQPQAPEEQPTPEPTSRPPQPVDQSPQQDQQSGQQQTQTPGDTDQAPKGVVAPPPSPRTEMSKEAVRPTASPVTPKKEKEGFSADLLEEASKEKKPEEQTTVFFEQFLGGGKEGEQGEKRGTPKDADEQAMEGVTPFSMAAPTSETERKEEERVAEESGVGISIAPDMPQAAPDVQAPLGTNTPYANLHPQVLELFERTVGVMTVMHMSGIKETSITLDNPKFASSVFFGSEIIIKEYTSAPKEFNIQINGSPQAMALIQGNTQDLMAAFQYGNYNFRVNRLETGLLAEKPLFKRKEPTSGDKQDQQGTT